MNVLPQNQLLISNDKDFVEPVFHDGAQSRQIANPSDRHFFGRANIRCRLPLPSTAVRRPPHLLAPSLRILRCRIAHSVQPTVLLVRQHLPVAFGQFQQQPDAQALAFFHSSFSFCPTFFGTPQSLGFRVTGSAWRPCTYAGSQPLQLMFCEILNRCQSESFYR